MKDPDENTPPARKPRKSSGWSDERRAKHAEAMKRWKPWEKSTGPKTDGGKERAAKNAHKHGRRSQKSAQDRRTYYKNRRAEREMDQFKSLLKAAIASEQRLNKALNPTDELLNDPFDAPDAPKTSNELLEIMQIMQKSGFF